MTEELEQSIPFEAPTEAEINERLNDLLARWHARCQGYSAGKGYPSSDAVFGQSKSTSVWDSWNGAEEEAAQRRIMEGFDAVIWTMPNTDTQPFLTALQFQARNFSTRAQVWNSPRLPADDEERAVLLMEARNMLLRALARAGVMS